MTDRRETILDVAEKLIRTHGYSGFSFREVASEVGIKSASVHYHFPTKPDLAAAVAKRYRERFAAALEEAERAGMDPISAWHSLFRRALEKDGLMCLCGILAAEGDSLPSEVVKEARHFIQFGITSLNEAKPRNGPRLMAQLEGAMLIARSSGDLSVFDEATTGLGDR